MRRSAEISGKLRVDRRQFTADLTAAKSEAEKFSVAMRHFAQPRMGGGAGGGFGFWTDLHSKIQMAGGALRTAGAAAKSFFSADVNMEGMVRGLAAVSDGTEKIKDQVKALGELAEKPGVGSRATAGQASIQLQAVGLGAKESRRTIEAFANEAANMNLPEEGLQEVIVSLRQMAKTRVDEQNLKEIYSRLPRIADIAPGLDKSDPIKFIRDLTAELEKMPKAIAGARENVDALKDSFTQWQAGMSGGRVGGSIGGAFGAAAKFISGDLAGGAAQAAQAGAVAVGAVPSIAPVDKFELSPAEVKKRQDDKKKREEESARLTEERAVKALKYKEEEVRLELLIRTARENGDKDRLARFEDELDILRHAVELSQTLSITEERAAKFIEQQNQARRDQEAAQERNKAAAERRVLMEQQEIDTLRAMGKEKAAQAMEESRQKRELMNGPAKMNAEQADAFIGQQGANSLNSTRKRIHGARFRKDTSGLDAQSLTPSALDAFKEHKDKTTFNPLSGFTDGESDNPLDVGGGTPRTNAGRDRGQAANEINKIKNLPKAAQESQDIVTKLDSLEGYLRNIDKSLKPTTKSRTR